jgi:hypothetical protein
VGPGSNVPRYTKVAQCKNWALRQMYNTLK